MPKRIQAGTDKIRLLSLSSWVSLRFDSEHTRLMCRVTMIATLIVGWSMQVRANLAVPVVFSFFVGVGTSFLATSEFRLS